MRNAVKIIQLDRNLAEYGPETMPLRQELKINYAKWIDVLGVWQREPADAAGKS